MPVSPTYPGIYIEEVPSTARTITAAPTSITVFVGYTHPFKTRNFGTAVRVLNFQDFEREFGGHYSSGLVDSNVALAVDEFFQNGGSDSYVVGLQPRYRDNTGAIVAPGNLILPSATVGGGTGIVFEAREPTDRLAMRVTVDNLKQKVAANDTADVTISYGPNVETFRAVTLIAGDPNHVARRIGIPGAASSGLVTVRPAGANFPAAFTAVSQASLVSTPPAGFFTTFSATDFGDVFEADSSLDKVAIFNLLVLPGVADNAIWSDGLAFAERKRAFVILDPPAQAAADDSSAPLPKIEDLVNAGTLVPPSANGALYFPYLQRRDPVTNSPIEVAPSGYVAGVYARTDLNRGVWKAPAGLETTLRDTTGVVAHGRMTDMRQGILNPIGVNCIRTFPGIGSVVFGARTVVTANPAYQPWRYVPVRRMALFIEQTLYNNLGWAVFEPNDNPLWLALRITVENFMLSLFSQGAFQGSSPRQAFLVQCDASTTTQVDIDNGIVNIIVAFRPLKPAEFVVIKIAQLAGQVQA
jgi:phage tail sheath protein FI